jgi:UDP-GlcNAc:undecaprenyl-phosphate GlcNAc-1-phosphate transferase
VLSQFSALIFGVCISLYLYNMTPARFFLGDSGAQVLGFMLAAIGILYNPPNLPQGSTWFMPILLLGIPIFDTTLVVVSRLRRHKPIFQADLAHTYHRLVRLGLTPGQAVLSVQIAAILLCNAAFLAMSLTPKAANVLFVCILLAGAAVIVIFERVAKIES